ncbi:hypothetical protein UPYG_G00269240 [Umbra pygmaea]|uniref:C-type lectin domain-containing protein n=1 Tax=Umbra pygmaea TaxID=75934 RepID=A0ABD0WAK1_UMBPY
MGTWTLVEDLKKIPLRFSFSDIERSAVDLEGTTIVMEVINVSVLACILVTILGTEAGYYRRRTCPTGYTPAGGDSHRCYQLVEETMAWQEALDYCKQDGGTLASVHSYQEFQSILNMVKRAENQSKSAWVGLNDLQQEGRFQWSDFSDTRWFWNSASRASGWGDDDCVALDSDGGNFDDIDCTTSNNFVCMKRAQKAYK